MSKKIDLGHIGGSSLNEGEENKSAKSTFLKKDTSEKNNSKSDFDDFESGLINLQMNKKDTKGFFKAKGDEVLSPLNVKKKRPMSKKKKWILFTLLFFFLVILGIGGFIAVKAIQANSDLQKAGINVSIGDLINNVIPNDKKDPELVMDGDLTNSLFIGVDTRSGSGDGGLENTDSMMIASYNHSTKKLALISVPRDNNVIFRVGKDNKTLIKDYRINAAYAVAQQYNYPGGGLALLRATLTEMTGLQIHYTAQVNFKAFKDVIDRVGGITVDVENSFTDYEYPKDDDSGVMTISFKAGVQQMNGAKALQYARSRHSADNGEGSDFSRARRQQKVLVAIQEKLKTTNYITDPNALSDFISIFGNNVKLEKTQNSAATAESISLNDISAAIALKDKADTKNVISVVLDPSIGGINSILVRLDTEAYMIGPKLGQGKYDDLKKYVSFVTNKPDLYMENRPGLNAQNEKQYAEIGFVDNGLGYSATLAKANELDKEFISSTYMAQLKAPLSAVAGLSTTPTADQTFSGVGLYDVTQKKPVTKDYLINKYNAKVLNADQIPDNIKKLAKDYDIVLFFTK